VEKIHWKSHSTKQSPFGYKLEAVSPQKRNLKMTQQNITESHQTRIERKHSANTTDLLYMTMPTISQIDNWSVSRSSSVYGENAAKIGGEDTPQSIRIHSGDQIVVTNHHHQCLSRLGENLHKLSVNNGCWTLKIPPHQQQETAQSVIFKSHRILNKMAPDKRDALNIQGTKREIPTVSKTAQNIVKQRKRNNKTTKQRQKRKTNKIAHGDVQKSITTSLKFEIFSFCFFGR